MPALDINWFRADKGYNPDIIRQSVKKRFRDPTLVDQIIAKDEEWRKLRFNLDSLKKEWNDTGKLIRDKKKTNKEDPCEELIKDKNNNQLKQKDIEKQEHALLITIHKLINQVGNIVHESVPISQNQDDNEVVRKWGQLSTIKITGKRGGLHHHQVLQAIGGCDFTRGQKIAGHRGYFLKGYGVILNQALINYGLKFLMKKNYEAVQPPFFMKKQIMAETCQLGDFDDQLYKVIAGQQDQYYLIATSQQPISSMYRQQWIDEQILPIKYGGVSTCFRKQAGAHGKDTWGIFRIHQFEKIQQFIITKPEDSWKAHEEMIGVAEQFYQSLELPYRVINLVSKELNDAASKKYDLQAWFPGYDNYRELVSCSNCTDFQSRNLQIRCGIKKKDDKEKKYVHMLNGTLCATQRTLCCILENYQTEQGLKVPKVLQQFVGAEFIPYVQQKKKQKQAPKDQKDKEKKGGEKKKEKTQKTEKEQQAKQEPKKEQAPQQNN